MKHRVIVVGRTALSSFMDGRTRYYIELVRSMSALKRKKENVNINYFAVYNVRNRSRFAIFLLEQLLMFINSLKLAMIKDNKIIIHLTYPELIWYIILPKGVKIVTFHDLYAYKNFRKGRLKHRLWNFYASLCYILCRFLCHYFIAVSEETKKEVKSKLRIKDYRIVVVPPGIYHLNNDYLKADRKSKSVGYITRCEAKKDPYFFARIIRELSMLDDGWNVYLIGKDCEEIYLKMRNIANIKLYYSDYVSQDILKKIFRTLFCLVYPTRQEGFGLTIMEALLNGAFVVIKKGSEIPQIVKQFCIEAESASEAAKIITLLWKEHGSAGSKYSHRYLQFMMIKERFSWDVIARRLSKLYELLLL